MISRDPILPAPLFLRVGLIPTLVSLDLSGFSELTLARRDPTIPGMKPRTEAPDKPEKAEDLLRAAYSDTLRRRRTTHPDKLNQTQLSQKADLPAYVVGGLERGQRTINMEEIIKICHALEVEPARFLDEVHFALQHAVQPLVEGLRHGTAMEGHLSSDQELRKAVDLVGEKLKQIFLFLDQAYSGNLPRGEAEVLLGGVRKGSPRSKPDRRG